MAPEHHEPLDRDDREDAPFLAPSAPGSPVRARHSHSDSKPRISSDLRPEPTNASAKAIGFRLKVILFAMILMVEVGFAFLEGPMVRIFEAIACRQYYGEVDPSKIGANGQVPEKLCKLPDIQSELAAVKGYHVFFDGLMTALLAFPYGLLADRRGRKPTLCLAIPGFAIHTIIILTVTWFSDIFPLRAVWLSCLAWLVGGGPVVAFAIIWTMMADVTTESERSALFFQFGIVSMGADFVFSAVSSWLMTMNPWVPMLIGWGIVFAGMSLTLFLPETKHALPDGKPEPSHVELSELSENSEPKHHYHKPEGPGLYHDDSDLDLDGEDPLSAAPPSAYPRQSLLARCRANYRFYVAPYTFILNRKPVLLLLSAFLVYRLSRGSSWFLTQYISTRYKWTLAQANLLVSFKPLVSVPLFLWGIPYIKNRMLNPRRSVAEKDLWLARASLCCLTVGTLGIGLSPSVAALIPSLIIQTSGSGFMFLTRSLITTLVERDQTARLYTAIEILQSLGNVVASLTITSVFQLGLQLGGFWIGLAWMMTSCLFCLVGLAIYCFQLPTSSSAAPEFVVGELDEEEHVE
ncbi:Major facilitator superfamily domain general substrate transporter [Penicillium lagena]|uniref:Major facilitator superfamily domain general substrate transporter n=1 Tax=Penicillium lagena TaxID=94218 RepID=UPI00254083E1|nr:Major facilitator superfamily domain general substrate transporter [Penicillium lagena]KAJ5613356.1 Major facilitator superfamily domain general substrate transporter [Penicillium lagena]